jgi:hypothetical protein
MAIKKTFIVEIPSENVEFSNLLVSVFDYKKNIIEKLKNEGKLLAIIHGTDSTKFKSINEIIFKDLDSVLEYYSELYNPTTDDGNPLWITELIAEIKQYYGNQIKISEIWDFNYQA